MTQVTELRVALTVADFDEAVAFYRDALGLEQVADWSGEDGRVVLLSAGRAMIELFDQGRGGRSAGDRAMGRPQRACAASRPDCRRRPARR